jgi:hypothetical protein
MKENIRKFRQVSSEETQLGGFANSSSVSPSAIDKQKISMKKIVREDENDREIFEIVKKRERQEKKRKNLEADIETDSRGVTRGVRSEEKRKKKKKKLEIDEYEEVTYDNRIVETEDHLRATAAFSQTQPMDPQVQRAWVLRKKEQELREEEEELTSSMTPEQLAQLSQLTQGQYLPNTNSLLIFCR